MANQIFPLPVKRISKYVLASADMYYSEEAQRDIYVYEDSMLGLKIWGETTNGGAATSIDLCQIFLEYALFCQTLHTPEPCQSEMRSFAESLGVRLADYIMKTFPLHDTPDPSACALESILEAIHAHLTIEHMGPELRFVVAGCPLLDASKHTGLAEVELAQFGFNVMCQSLIQAIDSQVLLKVPLDNQGGQVFTLILLPHPPLEKQLLASAHFETGGG